MIISRKNGGKMGKRVESKGKKNKTERENSRNVRGSQENTKDRVKLQEINII